MTRKIPPQHGERRCYLRGCRKPECEAANYRYMSRLRLDHVQGRPRRTTPDAAVKHLNALLDLGWTQAQISRASGINHRVLGSLLHGTYRSTNRSVEERVLALAITAPPADDRDTDSTGTIRRVRALIAIGYSGASIAAAVGIHRDALNVIARGDRAAVRVATAQSIARAYRKLSGTAGPSERAKAMAARRGWHGPMAWGDDIDDPSAEPEVDIVEPTGRNELGAYRRQVIQHLASFNVPEHEIADRLGMARSYVHDLIRDMGKAA